MKPPNRQTVSQLTDLPNIGKAMAGDLNIVGIQHPQELIGANAYLLYDKLCRTTGKRHDPCVIDVFLSVVDFMEGGDPKPWCSFTAERKGFKEKSRGMKTGKYSSSPQYYTYIQHLTSQHQPIYFRL